jgi:hypothetical protein
VINSQADSSISNSLSWLFLLLPRSPTFNKLLLPSSLLTSLTCSLTLSTSSPCQPHNNNTRPCLANVCYTSRTTLNNAQPFPPPLDVYVSNASARSSSRGGTSRPRASSSSGEMAPPPTQGCHLGTAFGRQGP